MLPLRIKLPYTSEKEFIAKYGMNVAKNGMFIATGAVKPEGTQVAFELLLANGAPLLRGEAVVARAQADQGNARRGMTLRFVRLDAASRDVVDRVVEERAKPPPRGVIPGSGPWRVPPGASALPAPVAGGAAPAPAAPKPADPKIERTESRALAEPLPAPVPEMPPPPPPAAASAPKAQPKRAASAVPSVFGLHFGTSECRVAVHDGREVRTLAIGANGASEGLAATLTVDERDQVRVGAIHQPLLDPLSTVYGLKRFIGARMRSPEAQALADRLPFTLAAEPEGDAGVSVRGRVHSAVSLAREVCAAAKSAAERAIEEAPRRCVLTVPASFSERRRAALKDAATGAGLDVIRLVSEPAALAAALGHGKGHARKRVLIYSLGGAAFDAVVVELTGDDVEMVSAGGDASLSGMDFVDRVATELTRRLGPDVPGDASPHVRQRLRQVAEEALRALGGAESTRVHVPLLAAKRDGSPLELDTPLTRPDVEGLCRDLLERTLETTRSVLDAAGLKTGSIDAVWAWGVDTRAPFLMDRLAQAFGRRPEAVAPDALARGAALWGNALLNAERGRAAFSLAEVLASPVGVATKDGAVRRLFEQNTRLPAEKSVAFPVTAGERSTVALFQGPRAIPFENEYLGAVHLTSDKAGEMALQLTLSPDGLLGVAAAWPDGRRESLRRATEDPDADGRISLLSASPWQAKTAEAPQGFFRGLKRLFGA